MARTRAPGSSHSSERFSSVSPASIPRSSFDRSFSHKTTLDSGWLVPVFIDEVLPGDTLNLQPAFFARMATPLRPWMDGIKLDWQFFFCPNRLVHDNWVKLMGERTDPADHNDYTVPQISSGPGYNEQDLGDYLGLPIIVGNLSTSALPFRMYDLVWNEWYRDENLQDSLTLLTGDGPDNKGDHVLMKRGKRKDYFTGALPFAQKGTAVTLPIGSTAPLIPDPAQPDTKWQKMLDGTGETFNTQSGTNLHMTNASSGDVPQYHSGILADLSNATAATINDMRVAIATQHLLERDARGGTRYREMVLAHFGVHTDDIRLMRPELLATGTMEIHPDQVAATTDAASPSDQFLGDVGAFATGVKVGRGFNSTFTEHGMVMGIVSIRAELSYQKGVDRWMSRKTRLDFYFPDLAHLGEQAVLSKEIYADADATMNDTVWGYQPRYEEYRHAQSKISGYFRSKSATSLDVWHLAQDFVTRPVLNDAFIQENPPIDRILVLTEDTEFLLDCFFKITHVRPMPRFGQPGLTRF